MDGLIYSVVARNMGLGIGSIWSPYFSETMFNPFIGQPAFAMWIQSFWFRAFGDSMLVEKAYSLSVTVGIGFLIVQMWKQITSQRAVGWAPLLFWILAPTITWSVPNNMLETTMTFFVCLSAYTYIVGYQKRKTWLSVLAGIFCALAVLSKGPVGLFSLSLPFFVWIVQRDRPLKTALLNQLVMIFFAILPIALIVIFNEDARISMAAYLQDQVGNSLTTGNSKGRFLILQKLVEETYVIAILVAVLFGVKRIVKLDTSSHNGYYKWSLIFFLVSLSGILPILISLKQRSYYMHSAIPFLGLAVGLLVYPIVKELLDRIPVRSIGFKLFKLGSLLLLLTAFIVTGMQYGKIGRDKNLLQDQALISAQIGQHIDVGICPGLREHWSLHGYFARFAFTDLYWTELERFDHIIAKDDCLSGIEFEVEKVAIPTQEFHLFKRVES